MKESKHVYNKNSINIKFLRIQLYFDFELQSTQNIIRDYSFISESTAEAVLLERRVGNRLTYI